MLTLSNVFHKNVDAYADDSKRYIINQGGTSSTKTYSTLQLLCRLAEKNDVHIEVAGLTVPHLKSGVLNDMPYVMEGWGYNFDDMFNISDRVLKFPDRYDEDGEVLKSGMIKFIAIDKIGKAHGGRRDILYINEANHMHYAIAEQLMVRTRQVVFIDYNPTSKFWVHTKLMKEQPERCILIKSTYKDNPCLEQDIIDMIESKKGDGTNNFWRVYGMGELGVAEGLIFDNWHSKTFDKENFAQYRHGIDWGFSNDPFAYVRMATQRENGEFNLYICDEVYRKKLLNKDSWEIVKPILKKDPVFCDCAEPKSVEEYKSFGADSRACAKGQGSVEAGVKFLQNFDNIYIHPDCPNVFDEFSNYQWKKDKNEDALPVPIDNFNHAIDAIRYALELDMKYVEDVQFRIRRL